MKGLKDSGLKVKKRLTCAFLQKGPPPIEILINNIFVKSMQIVNDFGVEFDCKMNWAKPIAKQIHKANKALHAIQLIEKNFAP